MNIGVLALQGDVREHLLSLENCGIKGRPVKTPADLYGLTGLIIPGGESTTVGKLLERSGLLVPLRRQAEAGMAIFGTCTGLILLAKNIEGYEEQPRLGLMDITVRRNAFGRQVESFETELPIPALGDPPLRAVFIRAPEVVRVGPGVEILASWGDRIVLVRQGRYLAAAFHPELTPDLRLHRYFLQECCGLAVGRTRPSSLSR
ncbi:MAG: pyridoxal 5'-phosphate synthase glutaminase subunit PdxT [Firmicutes bacterium]|nr:pyridoxal 5'-phosphate synthase glutaminase subunit PdxT [Bacillota bacterium]